MCVCVYESMCTWTRCLPRPEVGVTGVELELWALPSPDVDTWDQTLPLCKSSMCSLNFQPSFLVPTHYMLEEVIWPLWGHLVHHQIPKDRWSYLSRMKITEIKRSTGPVVLWGKTESFSTASDGPTLKPTLHGHEWADNVISQGNPTISIENSLWTELVSVLHLRSPTCPSW